VRLGVRAIATTGCIAQLLHAGDVALDPVEIDHHGRLAELVGDLGLECFDAHVVCPPCYYRRHDSTWASCMARGSCGRWQRRATACRGSVARYKLVHGQIRALRHKGLRSYSSPIVAQYSTGSDKAASACSSTLNTAETLEEMKAFSRLAAASARG